MPGARTFAEVAFLCAVVTLSLQWFPAIPLEGAQLSDLCFALAALAFLASWPAREIGRLPRFDLYVLMLFVVGVAASAVVNGGSYLKLVGHAELAVVSVISAALAQDERSAGRIRLALVFAAGLAALLGLVGVVSYYAGRPTALLNHYGDLLPGDYPRTRGTCVGANMLASVLATGAVLLMAERDSARQARVRWLLLGVIGVALLFTFSRTLLAVLVGMVAVLVAQRPTKAGWLALALGVALVAALIIVSARYEILLDPTRPWDAAISDAAATRWTHWGDALSTARAHPLFGVGPGRLATADGWSAHLTWLNLWALLGLAPLAAFAVLVVRGFLGWRAAIGPAAALLVLVLDSFARDIEDMRHLWVLLGLLLVARSAATRRIGSRG